MRREFLEISGPWRFQPDPCDEGEWRGYPGRAYDDARWRLVQVPCAFDECLPGMRGYEGAGWYRRSVAVPKSWQGRRVVLRFEGVNYHAQVWVNGSLVGRNEDGFLPFELPVHHLLQWGAQNVVALRVDNFRRPGEVPGLQRGWRPYGGILRPVSLVATHPLYIAQVAVTAVPEETGGTMSVEVILGNGGQPAGNVRLSLTVQDERGCPVARLSSDPVEVPEQGKVSIRLSCSVPEAQAWSPEHPVLYTAQADLLLGTEAVDSLRVRFGFRRVEVRQGRLLLNGSPVFLTGFDRHEDSPRTGMCPDEETVRQDLLEMKRAGANFVRLCHYPHDSGELDLCDELGLLVMAEIPLYWWNGLEEGPENCERKLAAAKRQLVGMIRRDINHPSVIFWSVSNETDERRPEVAEGNQELVRLAKATDDSRLAVHVSHCWPVCPHFEADDVLCVNAYPSWSAAIAGRPQGDVATATQFWRAHLEQLHRTYPNKPILVTEFGHPALEGVFGCSVGEDRQAQVLEAEFAGMSAPYVCGAVVWCYADHPWPEEDFIRYLTTSPYGLVTRERRPRRAFSVVSKLFRQKQSTVGPPPWQQVHPDGAPVEMVRHHMGDIPLVPFPEGFAIRPMRPGEVGLWTDIQRDAEPYLHISDDVFSREFGGDLQATQWRCFFVVNARGVAVGTVSAWYWHDPDGQEYGRLHWLAVRPSYQGKGLGKAALSYALRRLAEWHSRCMLITSAKRLRAIKMYLDFGFEPWLTDDEARVAWCQVFEALKAGES